MGRSPVHLEGRLKQDLVLLSPLVRAGAEVSQVLGGEVQVVIVPEQHGQGLLLVIAVLLLRHLDKLGN